MIDSIEDGVRAIYDWQHGSTSFNSLLCMLWKKADLANRARMREGWPGLEPAFALWEASGNFGDDLFKSFGLLPAEEETP